MHYQGNELCCLVIDVLMCNSIEFYLTVCGLTECDNRKLGEFEGEYFGWFSNFYPLRPQHGRAQALRGFRFFIPSTFLLRSHGPVSFTFLYAVSLGIPAEPEDGILSTYFRCSEMQGSLISGICAESGFVPSGSALILLAFYLGKSSRRNKRWDKNAKTRPSY